MQKVYTEIKKTADLIPYGKNARAHSQEQIDQLCRSITEFGFTNPVLIDEEGVLIAGHGRTMAAKQLGLLAVPAIVLAGLSPEKKKALRIADNQLALNASWDLDLLTYELAELDAINFDMNLLGFDEKFIAELLKDPEEPEDIPDEAGEASEKDNQKVMVVIGPYEFSVSNAEYSRWEAKIRAKYGFEKSEIIAGIKKRLDFK